MALETAASGVEAWWGEYGADEWSDALIAAMKLGGVNNLFFVSGSELVFFQESIAKAEARGWPAPRLVTMMHESVALNAALIVSRLLQVAMSEPRGPVYMAVPQETAMLPLPGSARFPTRDELGVARPVWPESGRCAADRSLVGARGESVHVWQQGRP